MKVQPVSLVRNTSPLREQSQAVFVTAETERRKICTQATMVFIASRSVARSSVTQALALRIMLQMKRYRCRMPRYRTTATSTNRGGTVGKSMNATGGQVISQAQTICQPEQQQV